jgi:hypothetical protein
MAICGVYMQPAVHSIAHGSFTVSARIFEATIVDCSRCFRNVHIQPTFDVLTPRVTG